MSALVARQRGLQRAAQVLSMARTLCDAGRDERRTLREARDEIGKYDGGKPWTPEGAAAADELRRIVHDLSALLIEEHEPLARAEEIVHERLTTLES